MGLRLPLIRRVAVSTATVWAVPVLRRGTQEAAATLDLIVTIDMGVARLVARAACPVRVARPTQGARAAATDEALSRARLDVA